MKTLTTSTSGGNRYTTSRSAGIPDLNDGVRLNVRPFVTADVLRSKVKVNWNKDPGRDPDGSERINDLHVGLAARQAAREVQKA